MLFVSHFVLFSILSCAIKEKMGGIETPAHPFDITALRAVHQCIPIIPSSVRIILAYPYYSRSAPLDLSMQPPVLGSVKTYIYNSPQGVYCQMVLFIYGIIGLANPTRVELASFAFGGRRSSS